MKLNSKKGFTLIELLVVIAIIGLLASAVMISFPGATKRANIVIAQREMQQLHEAIQQLELDTEMSPNHLSLTPCVQNPEVYLDYCRAGLQCTDGGFPKWKGPYFENVPKDPWGTYYYFDPDYYCYDYVVGCENMPNGKVVRAIVSFGPNKSESYTDGDNVVRILCVP